jgi:peptidoglycan/LPS O-acetylase OafA/YrhL
MGRAAGIAGAVIVALMLAGTIPVEIDDAWLWSLLALFLVTATAPDRHLPHRRIRTD